MRYLPLLSVLMLAGCNSGDLTCDSTQVTTVVTDIAMKGKGSMYTAARTALPSVVDPSTWSTLEAEAKQISRKIQAAKVRCGNSSMVCEDMSVTPTLAAFRNINYNGSRPMTAAEVAYYSSNFLPLFDQLRSLQDKRKAIQEEARIKEETQLAEFDKSVRYELGLIRPQQKNEQTGAIACEGRLSMHASTGTWYREVFYTAERTTDGNVFVRAQKSD